MEADEYLKRSIRHYEDGDYEGAISGYTKAIELDRLI